MNKKNFFLLFLVNFFVLDSNNSSDYSYYFKTIFSKKLFKKNIISK